MSMNFWLNIYKPQGISSARAVAIVKKVLQGSKVGHCGTLDVEAAGVLPLAIGEATKLTQFLVNARKIYVFTVKFGVKTDTADSTGAIIATTTHVPSRSECYEVCQNFIGIIEQVPPAFSALKVNGVRSYKLARQNNSILLPSRKIEIYNLSLLNFDPENITATYLVECSKGTYVRTLAEDIALSLQSLGFVIELKRTQVGRFKAEDALRITELEDMPKEMAYKFLQEKSWKIETALDDIPVLDATLEQAKKIKYGQTCFFDCDDYLAQVWIRHNGVLLAIGSIGEGCFNSSRVFNLI